MMFYMELENKMDFVLRSKKYKAKYFDCIKALYGETHVMDEKEDAKETNRSEQSAGELRP